MRCRFEKSLYDLIKGLRNHRGAEEEYVQGSLQECKTEIKSQDMGMALHKFCLFFFFFFVPLLRVLAFFDLFL